MIIYSLYFNLFLRQEENQAGNPTTEESSVTTDASQQIATGPGPPTNQQDASSSGR